MLNRTELREIASMEGKNGFFVSLYLNVDPIFNKKGDYMVHFKNMMKNSIETLDKATYKAVKNSLEKIESYVTSNKRMFKKGLVILCTSDDSFWSDYNLNVPVRNNLIINKTPYMKPLMYIADTYQRYAVLLVDKESARIFIIHLGEIVEYGEVHADDIPGKHKKGGWFALSQNHYERHIDYHVGMHLKEVVQKLDSFISSEYVGRIIIGGSDEAVAMVKRMLHKTALDKIIGTVKIEMFASSDDILNKAGAVVSEYEKDKELETIETLIASAMKNENAVLGLNNVLNALQEQRVMKLVFMRNYKENGYSCSSCGYLTAQKVDPCPYCSKEMEEVDYMVDLAGEKAIQQDALIEVTEENKLLKESGGIGAFLRF